MLVNSLANFSHCETNKEDPKSFSFCGRTESSVGVFQTVHRRHPLTILGKSTIEIERVHCIPQCALHKAT